MDFLGGYAGKTLVIDLSTEKKIVQKTPKKIIKNFLGGVGFAEALYYKESVNHPLHKRELIVIASGPLNGTSFPFSSNTVFVSHSPLTDTVLDNCCKGRFAAEMKYSGYDAIIIKGRSEAPVYLWIDDDHVMFLDASYIWGETTSNTQTIIREELGDEKVQVACIGPAGENVVNYASIAIDEDLTDRGGLGAVAGLKKLKAIAIRGTQDVNVADLEQLTEFIDFTRQLIERDDTATTIKDQGFQIYSNIANEMKCLGTKNWTENSFADLDSISEELKDKFIKARGCFVCPVACYKVIQYRGKNVRAPGLEELFSFGSLPGNKNLESIIEATLSCREYGLDPISTGSTLASITEWTTRGLLKTIKLNPSLFETSKLHELIRDIALRKESSNLLSLGAKKMSDKLGLPNLMLQNCGLELGCYTLNLSGIDLLYAVSLRGEEHMYYLPFFQKAWKGIGRPIENFILKFRKINAIIDSLSCCKFLEFLFPELLSDYYVKMINLVTGFDFTRGTIDSIATNILKLDHLIKKLNLKKIRENVCLKPDATSNTMYYESELKQKLYGYNNLLGLDKSGNVNRKEQLRLKEMIK